MLGAFAGSAVAQESWSPFKQWPETSAPRPPKGMARPGEAVPDRANLQPERPFGPRGSVERGDLDPVMAPDSSGLPLDLWRGLDLATFEELLTRLDLPPRSPVLHQLWRRMLLSAATPPSGAPSSDHFLALRLEALYRSGLLRDMAEVHHQRRLVRPARPGTLARKDIGLGQTRGRLPNDQVAGRAQRRTAGPPQGRGAVADGLLRRQVPAMAGRRSRRQPGARGGLRRSCL